MKKSKIILTIICIILIIIVSTLYIFLFKNYLSKRKFEKDILNFAEKNQSTIFTVDHIILFSSADAKYKTNTANNFTIQNLYQYTDIALFLKSPSPEYTLKNTLQKVSIENIKYTNIPNLGEPALYFKSINNFSKSEINENNLIHDTFEFNVSSNDDNDLNTPTLFNNLSNPLTFSYVNSNIKTDYTITDISTPITYDGSLLKKCKINLENIYCTLSFDIKITNNLNENFKTTVFINIPFYSDEKNILDGNITKKIDTNYIFYQY